MRNKSYLLRPLLPTARIASTPTEFINTVSRRRLGCLKAASRSSSATVTVTIFWRRSSCALSHVRNQIEIRREPVRYGHRRSWVQYPKWSAGGGRLRSAPMLYTTISTIRSGSALCLYQSARRLFHGADSGAESQPDNFKDWERLLSTQRRESGDDGGWAVFEAMRQRGFPGLIDLSEADAFRDEIVAVALSSTERTAKLIQMAHQLYIDSGYLWPDLYLKIMYTTLERARLREAARWHFQLAQPFCPGTEVLGSLISSFACDPSPQMQNGLRSLYIVSGKRGLYDVIISSLFSAGQSELARRWRRKLILFNDFPQTVKSRPFLNFLISYFPTIELTKEELSFAGLDNSPPRRRDAEVNQLFTVPQDASTGQSSDSMVAKWLASSWTSVEFAVNFVHQLGLRTVGPRSLQSLALREPDARGVASRLAQLDRLGIRIAPTAYCKVLIFFAEQRLDDLLADLLTCDVHPDEFDNAELRHKLLSTYTRSDDEARTGKWTARRRTRRVVAQDKAMRLLERVFDPITQHPLEWQGGSVSTSRFMLDNAIALTRRIANHDVAIPIRYWKILLFNLGRLSRLEELGQLCLEVVGKYLPTSGTLVPVHRDDWPRPAADQGTTMETSRHLPTATKLDKARTDRTVARNAKERERNHPSEVGRQQGGYENRPDRTSSQDFLARFFADKSLSKGLRSAGRHTTRGQDDEKRYIPTDYPFTRRNHPLQKLFDTHFRRSVVRWGFDQTLANPPSKSSLLGVGSDGIRKYDIACGVRLLALLRDQGVLVETEMMRATVMTRIAVGQLPGRRRNRSRDDSEFDLRLVKTLVDEAWGSKLLPNPIQMRDEIDRMRPELEQRYSVLLRTAMRRRDR
ncbi:hypothetical protein XA68_10215 [Ophiocordyceps unilateralis]|uniref:Pentatricopeptide repeat domain-containing protein n=1 Tax=Ophiocordyceps unilateralis TaxID=268505 RepID=A0A2A9PHN4_OPHUN|nr:hypothetical protein XA68_10215 [Ophiocordyceps unilateralis]